MVMSWFDKAARYLYVYSGTLSIQEWKEVVKRVYKDNEKNYGVSGSQNLLFAMVAYYCIEIGTMYKGRQAASKFRICNKWPDFSEADPYWKEEWSNRVEYDKYVIEIETKLKDLGKTIPFDKIEHSYVSRSAYELLSKEILRRHGEDVLNSIDIELRKFISLYSGLAIVNFINSGKLKNKELVPNIVTTYFLQRALVKEYGEDIISMKLAELEGRS